MTEVTRREFVQLSALSSLGLLIGIPNDTNARSPNTTVSLHPLIRIGSDGKVTLFAQNPDMGQGVKTSLPMIIAEELDVDWQAISIEQAGWDERLENQFSGGSLSIRINYTSMRQAGATAREMLLQAASIRWQIPVAYIDSDNGFVINKVSGEKLNYGDLADAAARLSVPEDPPLKSNSDFKLIGQSIGDVDTPKIVTGALQFSLDIRLPNMLYAVVQRSPYSDGQPLSFDSDEAAQVEGVVGFELLRNDEHGGRIVLPNSPNFVSGVAVLAKTTWAAMKAARLLRIDWDRPDTLANSADVIKQFQDALDSEGIEIRRDGDVQEAAASSKKKIEVTYHLPFLAHVPMEPMNCTAYVSGGKVEVWAPTQNPPLLAETLAVALDIDQQSITIHVMRSGGAFGRRFYADFAVDAALLSQKTKRPVKVVWTREDDVQHDYFRPASVQRIRAAADEKGRIVSWHHKMANYSRDAFLERDGNLAELSNYEFPAAFVPNLLYEYVHVPGHIPLGQWRAVDHSANVFVVASAIDELAHASGTEPLKFLRQLIGEEQYVQVREDFRFDASRLQNVISKAAEEADWGSLLPKGRGRGIAASYNQGAWVAEAAEVTVEDGKLTIDKIVAAIDTGLIINPQAAESQVQGGIIEGMSAALMGEITQKDGIIEQSNFHDYPICRMHQVPAIEVHFIKNDTAPRGLGEPPLPPVAPAICNAIFAATGQRIRTLPLTHHFSV
jgi:isoquinoline 1-oxidoreductase beta subunit